MLALTLVSGLFYGGDVHRLGSHEYATRAEAHMRLKAAGWLSYPLLLAGIESDNPERADRCGQLHDALPRLDAALVRLLLVADTVPEVPDATWIGLRDAVCRYAEGAKPLPVRGDAGQFFLLGGDVIDWMTRKPYYGTTEGGEVRIILTAARQTHRAGLTALVGVAAGK